MTTVRIRELPREHVTATDVAWKIARALRERGTWVLTSTSVSRTWRLRVGDERSRANVCASFYFEGGAEEAGVVFAIAFETDRARMSELAATDAFRGIVARLGAEYAFSRASATRMELTRVARNYSNPREILEELARLGRIIGATRERAARPAKRARALDARLWILADSLLRGGRWAVGTPSMALEASTRRSVHLHAFIGPIPKARTNRALLHTMLSLSAPRRATRLQRVFAAAKGRAIARGYVDLDPRRGPALSKAQPLSLLRALREADFLESELRALAAG